MYQSCQGLVHLFFMKIKSLTPGYIWAGLILAVTILPGNYIPEINPFWGNLAPDLIVHLLMFLILGYLCTKGALAKKNHVKPIIFILLVLFGTIYGIFIEWIQFFSNLGRQASAADAIANFLGFIIGVLIQAFPKLKKPINNNY